MKQHTDWTDRLRDELRDAEIRPSEGGWERLQRDLEAAEPLSGAMPAAPRRSFWRIYGPRIAAAAAVVLLGVVAGELLWHPDDRVPGKEAAAPELAAETPRGGDPLREAVARASGWSQGPSDETEHTAALSQERGRTAGSSAETALGERAGTQSGRTQPRQAAETTGPALGSGSTVNLVAQAVSREANPDAANSAGEGTELPAGARAAKASAKALTATPTPDKSAAEQSTSDKSAAADASAARSRSAVQTAGRAVSADSPTAGAGQRTRSEGRVKPQRTRRSAASEVDPTVGESRRRGQTSLSLFAGGGASGGGSLENTPLRSYSVIANDVSIVGNGNNFSPLPQHDDYAESSFRHHLPLSFGLSVRKELPRGFSLESGVVYTLLCSDVRLRYSSHDVSQKLHLLGIPLRVNWRFVEQGRFAAYLGAGGMVEKCISARLGGESVDEPTLQWSLTGAVGAQYRLVDHVGLYFEPEAAYYLTDTELQTSRSDAPLSLTLRLGVRVLF